MAYSLSWKEIINMVTFVESLAKVIGTLGSLGKDFIQCKKVLKAFLVKIIKTFCPTDTSHALTDRTRFNTGSVKTDFQFRYIKACISWLGKPNESRNESRVKELNTEKPVREDVQQCEMAAGGGETAAHSAVGTTLLTSAASTCRSFWLEILHQKCDLLCVLNQRQKDMLGTFIGKQRKAEGPERIIFVVFYYWLFIINTEWQLSGCSKKPVSS